MTENLHILCTAKNHYSGIQSIRRKNAAYKHTHTMEYFWQLHLMMIGIGIEVNSIFVFFFPMENGTGEKGRRKFNY